MTTPTFKNLWPTQLMEITLPGHDQANPILADHIEKLDIERSQMTTDYRSDNLFDEQHPVVQWLKQSVQRAVVDYAQYLGIDYSLDFAIQAWANVNRMGDYHNLHNHPHAWLKWRPTTSRFRSMTRFRQDGMIEPRTASAFMIRDHRPI